MIIELGKTIPITLELISHAIPSESQILVTQIFITV